MELLHINTSLDFMTHYPLNSTEKTVYERCKNMPTVIIWYLSLQFTNMIVGLPANIMVLWLMRRNRNKRDLSSSDIFILHLAVLDMVFCLATPLELTNILYLTTKSSWYVQRFIYGMKDSSPLLLSCICLDRYMAVVHPTAFPEFNDRQHRQYLAIVVWLVTLVYATGKCAGNIPNFENVFTVMILSTFAFMLFCNISILCALQQSRLGRDERHPVKKRAFKLVLVILAIIVFNYLPPVVLLPFKNYFSHEVFLCYIHYIAFGLMDLSSSIQPMLYLSREKLPCSLNCCPTGVTQIQLDVPA